MLQDDIYIKQRKHTDAFQVMGIAQPEVDEIFVTWMGEDRARYDQGEDTSTIIRLDKNVMYSLDHNDKTYEEIPFRDLSEIPSATISESEPSDKEKQEAEEFASGVTAMMKAEAKVTETGKKKKIRGWNCREYTMIMKMMTATTTSEMWATEDIKINYRLYRELYYRTLLNAMLSRQPGSREMFKEMIEEMKKIKGILVLSTTTSSVMGVEVKTIEELVEVAEKKAPEGNYEIPEGYKKT